MVPVTAGSTFTATITGVGDVTAVFAERAAGEDQ
jgi:2-keto-4-pentenoate hydratase